MNNEVRDFYKEEAEYDKTTQIVKDIIYKTINIDMDIIKEKFDFLNIQEEYYEFFDLFDAVTGKETNKYFYSKNEEQIKYTNLELNKVYKINQLPPELQEKCKIKKVLVLEGRILLAPKLLDITKNIKEIFSKNIQKGDGHLSTIDSRIITEEDIYYFDTLISYLETIIDKVGSLKILVNEKAMYGLKKEKENLNKKNPIIKWFNSKFTK